MEFKKPEIEEVIRHMNPLLTACFSPDQSKLCSAGCGEKVILTNYNSQKVFNGHKSAIQRSDFSSNGKYLVTASDDKTSRIWNVESEHGNSIKLEGHLSCVRCVRFLHEDEKKVISGSYDETIKIWDIERKKEISTLRVGGVCCIDILPDNQTIVSGDVISFKLRIWDFRSGKCVQSLDHHKGVVCSVQFHPNTFSLASGSFDKTVKILDFRTFKLLQKYQHCHGVRSICFHPSGKFLLSGSTYFPGTCYCGVKLFDISHKKELYTLNDHRDAISCVQFSADGEYFVTGSWDNNAFIWNFPLGRRYRYQHKDEEERLIYLLNENLLLCDDEKDEFCEHNVLEIRFDDFLDTSLFCFKFFLVTK